MWHEQLRGANLWESDQHCDCRSMCRGRSSWTLLSPPLAWFLFSISCKASACQDFLKFPLLISYMQHVVKHHSSASCHVLFAHWRNISKSSSYRLLAVLATENSSRWYPSAACSSLVRTYSRPPATIICHWTGRIHCKVWCQSAFQAMSTQRCNSFWPIVL